MTTSVPPTTGTRDGFDRAVEEATGDELRGASVQTVQANIGLRCNLACRHCHLACSAKRTEQMDWPTMQAVLDAARRSGARTLDVTGGAPEMHPHFRRFIRAAREIGLHVMVRTNLTILLDERYRDLPEFLRELGVHLAASLPCYLEENVDKQRGPGAYAGSIAVLKQLNEIGYGTNGALRLDLVYNAVGPALPPPQDDLEDVYRRELRNRYGIEFSALITITNMPIGRFLDDLRRRGKDGEYWQLLKSAFNGHTMAGLMCRHQAHVGYDGTVYDCDYNFALGVPVRAEAGTHVRDLDPGPALSGFVGRRIATGEHCYGCTAGHGSSCRGAIA